MHPFYFPLKTLVCMLMLFGLSACNANATSLAKPQSFTGTWKHVSAQSRAGKPFSQFILYLSTKGNKISGRYCYITHFGSRIDCPADTRQNVSGNLSSNSQATITFYSPYNHSKGRATLQLAQNSIHWVTTAQPATNKLHLPNQISLTKTKTSPPNVISIKQDKAQLYASPSKNSEIIASFHQGAKVKTIGLSDDLTFWKVTTVNSDKPLTGWVTCQAISMCM